MTRKSKREIERALDGLDTGGNDDTGIAVVYDNGDQVLDADGNPVGPDGVGVAPGGLVIALEGEP